MLQVRISNWDGSSPVIMDKAINIVASRSVSSSDEGCSFDYPKNDSKADLINPNIDGYTKRWEIWDTNTGKRLNYGPPNQITENGPNWKFTGFGRSKLLSDFYQTKKTFYASIENIVDDLRFENIAIQPRTSTLIHNTTNTPEQALVFGNVLVDEQYYGISKSSKDNVIDDDNGLLRPGDVEPPNTSYTTNSFWAGMSKTDSIIVDLGEVFDITKIRLGFPWWGGLEKKNNRSYQFTLDYALDDLPPLTIIQGRNIGPMTNIYDSGLNSRIITTAANPYEFYLGAGAYGDGVNFTTFYALTDQASPVPMRYIRVAIQDVYAWYGSLYDDQASTTFWEYQCNPNYGGRTQPPIMKGNKISDTVLAAPNDCFASVVEIGVMKEILPPGDVNPLALQRIDNTNLQITYMHVPDPSETTTTTGYYVPFRKFEPGGFFKRFQVNYSGATKVSHQFFRTDCANCYPDPFNFGIADQNNTLIYATDSTSGNGASVDAGAYTKSILMRGSPDATITLVDSWPSVVDALSWGSSYSFTKIIGDTATVRFRGQSFRWYATVPDTEDGATCSVEIRSKVRSPFRGPRGSSGGLGGGGGGQLMTPGITSTISSIYETGEWTTWATLEDSLILDSGISSQMVYEIPFEYGILQPETVYEIRITNLDGGYCSIDSFEGYWSASFTMYNQDSNRLIQGNPQYRTMVYDQRYSGGSVQKWNSSNYYVDFYFEGDRIVVLSDKAWRRGIIKFQLIQQDNVSLWDGTLGSVVMIPGGNPDGSVTRDLQFAKRGGEIPQYVAFDSNDYYTTTGLPWGRYQLHITKGNTFDDRYNTTDTELAMDNFQERCKYCNGIKGNAIFVSQYVYLDAVGVHEQVGLSVSFEQQTHLDILTSVATAIQTEWDVDESGIVLTPRIGIDTKEILREGHNTLVSYEIVSDVSNMATMLLAKGASIDGLPLSAVTEDRATRKRMGRTIMRENDFTNIADYFQLIGLSRTELKKRGYPDLRITVTHIAESLNLNHGDSFKLFTKKLGPLEVRIMRKETSQSDTSGTTFALECIRYPGGEDEIRHKAPIRPIDPRE